ncbi:uncharacterized protein LOC113207359 isoform X2 [Frankliniella occidentalis]|uniref:Uncharacterized protein LOC113207359 isoform X2 n=1 Tax=Frankliniella occidentalis TaxID=133901 RepID=A0A6J1SF96_FRAOC|nr:uncharacterized protein LOC113207359 isoform X2 [Frankliniella occidentalis]
MASDCSSLDLRSPESLRRRPGETRAILRNLIRREISAARVALEAVQCGKQLEQHVPYVNHAVHILTAPTGQVHLRVNCSTASGEDKILDAEVSLVEGSSKEKASMARLALYLLVTRGRLSKASAVERLGCGTDKEWSARVLQVVAPRLEKINVNSVGIAHLQILALMSRLRQIKYTGVNDDFAWDDLTPFDWNDEGRSNLESNDPQDTTRPFWLTDLPKDSSAGLVSIWADLPRQLLLPLIVQHRHTLRELTVVAGLHNSGEDTYDWERHWSRYCDDLPLRLAELLERFPLPALRLVKLCREISHSEEEHALCDKQLRAVRRVLGPRVTVFCTNCG